METISTNSSLLEEYQTAQNFENRRTVLNKVLRNTFLLQEFREGQIEIIESILDLKDTLAVLPTGGGKSLCYQLPAVLSEGTTIVFSPLISLMKDQVDSLKRRNIPATYLNSTLSDEAQKVRIDKLKKNEYKMFFVAPERLTSRTFTNALEKSEISNIIIDEAHCISEWGHNFRPMYLKIASVFNYIRRVPISAFTATATPEVRNDIIKYLHLENPNIFVKGFARENLTFKTEVVSNKKERLHQLVKKHKSGSQIIYVGTRKSTQIYADYLNSLDIPAIAYHGGLLPFQRKEIQEKFISNEINTIVATNAFGMGIDKPDVRLVVHLDLPTTLEAYYQEAGRAGRDGNESYCHLLYSKNDEKLPSLFIFGAFPDISEIRKVIRGINDLVIARKNLFISGKVFELSALFNIESTKLRTIFRLLKRNELIEFYDDAHLLRYSLNNENLNSNSISKHFHRSRKEIFEYLINLNSDKAQTEVDLKDLSTDFGISLDSCETEIRSFESLGLLDISHNAIYSGVKLFESKISELIVEQLLEEIEERKLILINKANSMLDYLRTDNCKQGFILNYFGEISGNYACGKCTSCSEENPNLQILEGAHIHNFKRELTKKSVQKQEIIDKLVNSIEKSDSMDSLAKMMKQTKPELANLIQSAIEDGWLVRNIKFINNELLREVRIILKNNSNLRLSQIRSKLTSPVDFPELRVAVAIERKLLLNNNGN
jgi:ATP-dependent DNA helicase RecQ